MADNGSRPVLGGTVTNNDLVFCQIDGKPLRPNSITSAWISLASRANIKHIRLHDAGHTHASVMPKQGIHPKIVQERLGHSSIAVTLDIYSHVSPSLQAAAAMRFDDAFNNSYNKKAVEKVY
jgi:integrase